MNSLDLMSFQRYISSVDVPGAEMTICALQMRVLKFREVAPLSGPSSKRWGRHFSPGLLTPIPAFLSSTRPCSLTHQPHPRVSPDGDILEELCSLEPFIWACRLVAWCHLLSGEAPLSTLIY